MNIPAPHSYTCTTCHRYWNKQSDKNEPAPHVDEKGRALMQNECAPGTHKWELSNPDGVWAYEGLHILKNDDLLTVYDKDNPSVVLWSGIVSLKQRKSYHEHIVSGYICHTVPRNVPINTWKEWFFGEYPAELMLGRRSMESWGKYGRKSVENKLKELGRENY